MFEEDGCGLSALDGPEPYPKHGDDGLLLMESVGDVLPHGALILAAARIGPIDLPEATNGSSESFEDLWIGLVDTGLGIPVEDSIAACSKGEMEASFTVEQPGGPSQLFSIHS